MITPAEETQSSQLEESARSGWNSWIRAMRLAEKSHTGDNEHYQCHMPSYTFTDRVEDSRCYSDTKTWK